MGHESSTAEGGDSSTAPPSSARRLAQNKYQKAVDIEKLLSTTIQSKGPFDPSVRILRSNLRELYESIVLEDHEFAESREIEQLLWRLHYTRIEEFRSQIRKTMAAVANSSGPANLPLPGNKSSGGRHQVQKVTAVFRSFLSEATGFYHDLILKIRSKHKLSEDDLSNIVVESKEAGEDEQRIAEIKRCQLSCHRCLIYLGDLARYKEYYSDADPKNHDWSIAAGFYVKAASLWPASGNPHNQLAVLATYVGDEMLAVYHYFRSLAAEVPFHTAKDNLVLLFEKNRQTYLRLVSTSSTKPAESSGDSELSAVKNENLSNINEAVKHFQTVFVRLHGILFTKTSLETFEEVQSITIKNLQLLLELIDRNAETFPVHDSLKGSERNIFIQIVSILIFVVHHVNAGADSHQPTYAEILQRSSVLKHAFTATFQCAAHLLEYCTKANDPSSCMVLPAALVLVEWLSCRPEIATGTEMKEEENRARCYFWKNCAGLLNKFLDQSSVHTHIQNKTNVLNTMLSEDFELWGFVPLLPTQSKINFIRRSSTGLGSKKEKHARIERLIQAGKLISTLFEGNDDTGIYYDHQTNVFILASDKKKLKQKEVVKPDTPAEESSLKMPEPVQVPVDMHLPVKALPVKDDDDEELIVFKPLLKADTPPHISISDNGNNAASSLMGEAIQNSQYNYIPDNSAGPDATSERNNARNLPSEVLQSQVPHMMANVPNFASSSFASMMSGIQSPVRSTMHHIDSKPGISLEAYRALQNIQGPQDGMPNLVPGSGAGHPDWRSRTGLGMIPDQQPWTPISGNINWQPHNMLINRLDTGLANASFGFQSAINPDNRPVSVVLPPNLDMTSSTSHMSDVVNTSVSNSTLQSKQSVSMANVHTNSVSQSDLGMHGLSFSASENLGSCPLPSSLTENEKAPQKAVSGPVGMRPPPGFGPLPSKSPSPFSTSLAVPLVKPALPGQIGSQRPVASMGDHTIDSTWLDSFGPLKREVEQVGNMVHGKSSSGFGWLPGGTYPSLDPTVSPFPGMKPSERFMNPQQPQSSVNHELLQRQQLIEQHQHQLLLQQQRRQLQQLYAAQVAAYQIQKQQQQYMQQQRPNMLSEEPSHVNGSQSQQVQQQEQVQQQPQLPRQQSLVQSIWSKDHTCTS